MKQPLHAALLICALVVLALGAALGQTNLRVTLPGTFQTALGGPSNWNPSDERVRMLEASAGVYEFVAALPKGKHEYKVAVGGSWAENYGTGGQRDGSNIVMQVNVDNAVVRFMFNANTKTIMDSINQPELTAPERVPEAFMPKTQAPQPNTTSNTGTGDSTRVVVHYHRPGGDYEGWNLWVWPHKPEGKDGKPYVFTGKDDFGAVAVVDVPGKHNELGVIVRLGEWQAKDIENDRYVTVRENGKTEIWILQNTKSIETSSEAAKAVLEAQRKKPQRGDPAFLDSNDTIRAFMGKALEPKTLQGKVTVLQNGKPLALKSIRAGSAPKSASSDSTDPKKVVVAGTIQGVLGGNDWNPNSDITRMTETKPGVFELVVALPKGQYEYKIARGGTWSQNWGADFEIDGANIGLNVAKNNTVVRIVADFNARSVKDSINHKKEVVAPAVAPKRPQVLVDTSGPVDVIEFQLAAPIKPADIAKALELRVTGQLPRTIYARDVLNDAAYQYNAPDLGSRHAKNQTTFKVWSPVSSSVELFVFDNAVDGPRQILDMQRVAGGVWAATVAGDLHGKYYQYRFKSYGETRVAPDINCYAASPDSTRSMVVDLKRSNPKNWNALAGPRAKNPTDAVIYELMIRDFTVEAASGVKPEWRGKYLGLTQRNTRVPDSNVKTGLDHLVDLGVTDVHLMPFQNFNPKNSRTYNWGYETNLFNVPEEQYSTSEGNPTNTILEVKSMIQALHSAGLRVVMDVVYNHTMPEGGDESAFWQTVPYFYFRTNDRGDLQNESGVGNAMHDERLMVRKYIRDSLAYWLREYGVDGFRFDLVGMFAKSTVEDINKTVRAIRPDATLYGEPWTGGGPTRFGKGTQRGTGMAVFNDNFRNAIRGDLDGTKPGFAMGGLISPTSIKRGLVGSIAYSSDITDFADEPSESINYVSAHDNLAIWDKIERAMPQSDAALKARAVNLATALVLTAQGTAFLEGGAEIGRSKNGNHNSYNAGDPINRYDWARATTFGSTYTYHKGLIALRKAHPAFRLPNAAAIRKSLQFLPDDALPFGAVGFTLEAAGDSWKRILVIHNGSQNPGQAKLPQGTWNVVVNEKQAGIKSLGSVTGTLGLAALGSYVLYQ